MSVARKTAKTLAGEVVSNRMDKTILVRVSRKIKHPLYEKYVKRSSKIMAHDENNECREGDMVLIESSRPISKNKAWRFKSLVSRPQEI